MVLAPLVIAAEAELGRALGRLGLVICLGERAKVVHNLLELCSCRVKGDDIAGRENATILELRGVRRIVNAIIPRSVVTRPDLAQRLGCKTFGAGHAIKRGVNAFVGVARARGAQGADLPGLSGHLMVICCRKD